MAWVLVGPYYKLREGAANPAGSQDRLRTAVGEEVVGATVVLSLKSHCTAGRNEVSYNSPFDCPLSLLFVASTALMEQPIPRHIDDRYARLAPVEVAWRDRQEYLESRGYMLRPRYRQDWVPSWGNNTRLAFFAEDALILPVRSKLPVLHRCLH